MPLRPKQQRFVAEYLVDQNATQAAIRAGYKSANANVTGPRMLADVGIAAEIVRKQGKQLEKAGLSAEKVKEVIRRVLDADIRSIFDEVGNLRPIHTLSDEAAALVAGCEVVQRNLVAGDGQIDTIIKLKMVDRSKYVEMAAKHFGLLIEKIEHSGGLVIHHVLGDEE